MSNRGFEELLARGHPEEFENSKNLATSSSLTRKDRTGNFVVKEQEFSQEPMTTIPEPCFQRRARCKGHEGGNYHTLVTGCQNHASEFGTFSHKGMINYPGYHHLGRFPELREFQS